MLSFIKVQCNKVIKYEMAVRCEACKAANKPLHFIPKKEFTPDHYCQKERKYVGLPNWMPNEGGKLYKELINLSADIDSILSSYEVL